MTNKLENHILIADENAQFLDQLSTFLTYRGYAVKSTGSGREALKIMQNGFDPDVVIMNTHMKELDGISVAREIRKKDQVFVAPIIFTTDSNRDELRDEAYRAGGSDFLIKPVSFDELTLKINNFTHARKLYKRIKEDAIKDPLTGLFNRRFIDEKLDLELARCRRYGHLLSVILVDVDKFKYINDHHGHPFGDTVLKETARILKGYCRGSDILGRYGGDEFILILNGVNISGAEMVANRILKRITSARIRSGKISYKVALSMGGVDVTFRKDLDSRSIVRYADMALYLSKEKGGNCISFWREAKDEIDRKRHAREKRVVNKYAKQVMAISQQAKKAYVAGVIDALLQSIQLKDGHTAKHALLVAKSVKLFAKHLNLSPEDMLIIENAAKLCDIGKVGLPDSLLTKKERYDKSEFEVMQKHSVLSHKILKPSGFLKDELPIILCHHERYDGLGYPHHIKGERIPEGARMISIVDAYQAMISERPYRKRLTLRQAKNELNKNKGKQFDPHMIDVFLKTV